MGFIEDQEATWKTFTLDDEYRWVLLVGMLCVFHYIICIGIGGGPRGKIFTQEFMEEKFGKEHAEAFDGAKIGAHGYPDSGSGIYTMAAGYKNWMEFMKAQRVHYNYLEHILQMLVCMLIAGVHYPRVTWIWGLVYFFSRVIYQVGYIIIGPKGRYFAAPIVIHSQ